MGVRTAVARLATRHAHVLVVEVPGSWRIRAAVERETLRRGWALALSPADADVLVVCGESGPAMAEAINGVWHQMPGPRVRIDVLARHGVADRLDEARVVLLDTAHHQRDAHDRPAASDLLEEKGGDDMDMNMDDGEDTDTDTDGHDMDMEHGMDMDDDMDMDMDMEMAPGGIPLAEGAEDRDALEMDVLNVLLGPVLPYWPAGLVLRCTLHGDVIVDTDAEVLDPGADDDNRDDGGAARVLDQVVSVLALAGWADTATEARRIRDGLLEGGMDGAAPQIAGLQRRVRRSRTLRWSLRGIRPVDDNQVQRDGLPVWVEGDTHDRLLALLERATRLIDDSDELDAEGPSATHVAQLVTGLDLATARLVVASLGVHSLTREETSHAR